MRHKYSLLKDEGLNQEIRLIIQKKLYFKSFSHRCVAITQPVSFYHAYEFMERLPAWQVRLHPFQYNDANS